jgi:hypothetical protein
MTGGLPAVESSGAASSCLSPVRLISPAPNTSRPASMAGRMTRFNSQQQGQGYAAASDFQQSVDPIEYSIEGAPPKPLAPPFDEPIYTVQEAAKILRLSPNQARAIFRDEPGVHDLANDYSKSRFRLRRRSQLRIPHSVLVRFWKSTEICQHEMHRRATNGSRPEHR